jgi:hypothetical protein
MAQSTACGTRRGGGKFYTSINGHICFSIKLFSALHSIENCTYIVEEFLY